MPNEDVYSKFTHLANHEKALDKELCAGATTKHWSMDAGKEITYQRGDSHTLSLYLNGGTKNTRKNLHFSEGGPGKICLMPQHQDSTWQIKQKVEFVHLYFDDLRFKQFACETADMDVRFVELRELNFLEDPKLKELFLESFLLSRNSKDISPLFAEQSLQEVMFHLLKHYNGFSPNEVQVKGGLSPHHMKQTKSFIHDSLSQKLTIEQLAQNVNLSPFHFARMFKTSFGESPANFITRTRVNKIKQQLQTSQSLVEISQASGFSQQSHMSQYFKKLTGMTPAKYRNRTTST